VPMHVELVSPERIVYSGAADMVIARTVGGGDIAFLPGHAPFVGALAAGTVTIRPSDGGGDQVVPVSEGFVEVSGGESTVVSILAEAVDGEVETQAENP
jgi:F-type H+-transporting ATPase subunit epsilon